MIVFLCVLLSFGTSFASYYNLILIGPPGSGKGSLSTMLVEDYGYMHICPGDMVRAEIKNETELGIKIKPIVEKAGYIDDTVIFEMIQCAVEKAASTQTPFIIDGFPRNDDGLDFLITLLQKLDLDINTKIVHFIITDEECIHRIAHREVCFGCCRIYNTITKKSFTPAICDHCESPLEVRIGDSVENAIKRVHYYRTAIEPLIERAALFFSCIQYDTTYIPIDEEIKPSFIDELFCAS